MEKIKKLNVFYAPNEYTGEVLNQDMALLYAAKPEYKAQWPLLVETVEHGGWSMMHYFDAQHPMGVCVGSANDAARFPQMTQSIRDRLGRTERELLPEVRRSADEAIADATKALYSLGLTTAAQGVLTVRRATDLYSKRGGEEYCGLDLDNPNTLQALRRFSLVCGRVNPDHCI